MAEPVVTPVSSIRLSDTAARFQGGDDAPVSMFITRYPSGRGPDLHFHPYPEVFYVEAGVGTFHVDGAEHEVAADHIVVVPAEAIHGFKNRGGDELRVVSVHPSPHVIQTDL